MATAAIEKPVTDLATVNNTAAVVLFDNQKFDEFYDRLKADADAVPVDLSTAKGRAAIASIAAKVRGEKASIDKDRLRLTKEWRDMTAQVNGAWNVIKERLDGLAVDVRAPLTEWEKAEEERAEAIQRSIDDIHIAGIIAPEDTAATVRLRGKMIWEIATTEAQFGDRLAEAKAAKESAVAALKAALTRLEAEEADRAELARLRAEKEERDRVEAEQKAQAEREAAEAAEIEREKARLAAKEKAEAERIEHAKAEAAEAAQRQAEEAAQAERERIQREHDEAIAAERAKAEAAEKARQDEADRITSETAARDAEAKRIAAEQAEREANKAHRTKVKRAAKEAIMTCGVSEDAAQKIVLAIIANEIPAVTLRF